MLKIVHERIFGYHRLKRTQLKLLGHVTKKEEIANIVFSGKSEGRKLARSKQKML